MQEPDVRNEGNQRPLQLEIFYSGGRRGVSMLRWGGSGPAPPAPQRMPSPNKLPSCSAALPPERLSFRSAPDRADPTEHKGRLSPACGQCHMAGWGRGEAAGPRPGAEGAEGAAPGSEGVRIWKTASWAGQGPSPPGSCLTRGSGQGGDCRHTSTAGSEPRPCRWSCSSCFILGFSVRVCHTRTCPRRASVRAGPGWHEASGALSMERILSPPLHTQRPL